MNTLDRNHSRLNNLTKHVQKKHKHTFRYHRNINLSGVVTWSHCSEHCCTDSRKWTKDSDSVLCWAVQPWNRTRYRPVGPTRAQQVDNLAGTWSSGHCRWRQLCSLLLLRCPWGLEYLTNMKQPLLHSPHTHTHPLNGHFSGTTQVSLYKTNLDFTEASQETVSGSGISWAICKSAPCSRQTTTPAPHHSVSYRPDALPATQPTASKHWRQLIHCTLVHKLQILGLIQTSELVRTFTVATYNILQKIYIYS